MQVYDLPDAKPGFAEWLSFIQKENQKIIFDNSITTRRHCDERGFQPLSKEPIPSPPNFINKLFR
jgi:hypothetical protein